MNVKQSLIFDYFLIEFKYYQNKHYETIGPLSTKKGNFITSLKNPYSSKA